MEKTRNTPWRCGRWMPKVARRRRDLTDHRLGMRLCHLMTWASAKTDRHITCSGRREPCGNRGPVVGRDRAPHLDITTKATSSTASGM